MSQQEFHTPESFMNFDTHKSFKAIVAAGFSEPQAEAIVELVRSSKEYDFSTLATKEQVRNFEQRVADKAAIFEQKIDNLDAKLNQKIDNLDARLNQKIDNLDASLNQKIDNLGATLNQKIDNLDATLNQKMDSGVSRLQAQMAKQDSQQKAWMMSMLLTIIGIGAAIFLKT